MVLRYLVQVDDILVFHLCENDGSNDYFLELSTEWSCITGASRLYSCIHLCEQDGFYRLDREMALGYLVKEH